LFGFSSLALRCLFQLVVGKKDVIKVASGLVPDGGYPLNDRRPQGATLQVVASFTHKLTTTF